jgi:cytochrome P450
MKLLQSFNTLKNYRRDPVGFITKMHKEQGHQVTLNIFGKKIYIISHPRDVLHVLKNNSASYTKGRTTRMLRQFLGNGLITNEGDSWRKQHKLIRPVMNLKSVFDLAPKIDRTVQDFMSEIKTDVVVDSFHEMNRLTWRIILNTLFSQKVTTELDDWLHDILDLMRIITRKTRSSIPIPFWIPTKDHRRMKNIIKKFDQHVFKLIQDRRKGDRQQDLLQLLIDAQEEGALQMTDHEIRDEIMTFMMAGHETITNSMAWALIELAKNPVCKEKMRAELIGIDQKKYFEELNSLPYLGAVIDEVMRLWPPVWVFMRQATKVDLLDHLEIPKNANVVLAPILSHRSSDFWENPLAFTPERFLPQEKKNQTLGAYYPFGLGPRACIGAYFASMEARLILSHLVTQFDWEINELADQTYEAGISLRPTNNILMIFRRRSC